MNTLNRGTERRAWPLTKLNVPVKIIGESRPPPSPGLPMLWLWIEIKQYELDSRGTTPLNSNAKKRKGKTLASFWQRRFPFWRKIKPLIPVLLTTYFSPAMKTVYFLTFKIFGFLLSFHTVFTAMCVVVSVVYAMFLNHEHLWCTKYWFSDTGSQLIISTVRQFVKVLYFFSGTSV